MNIMAKRQTSNLPLSHRIAHRALAMAALAILTFAPASFAQFEKTVLIDGQSWSDFYTQDSTSLPQKEGFRTYNIAFERAFQIGAPNNNQFSFRLGGVQIRSEGEDSWVLGPVTFNELLTYVQRNRVRIIDIEKVNELGVGSGSEPLYFVVLTPNTGSQAKTWYWLVGVTFDKIRDFEKELNLRVIDLEILDSGYYAAIFIANTGADKRDVIYGNEMSEEDIKVLADWGAPNYKLVHIGYEGNSAGDGGVYWNYIFEKTNEVAFALPVFDLTANQLKSVAYNEGLRISMIDFNRYTGLYAAILVEQLP